MSASSNSYENSRIWQRGFSSVHENTVCKLVDTYSTAWARACRIAQNIAVDAAGLTLHDEAHFLALWNAADLLVPDDAKLTPVEIFALGIAILIHDAAHTVIAYRGGIEELSKTDEWADNLAVTLGGNLGSEKLPSHAEISPETRKIVTFETVRALHAKQAEKILSLPFQHPSLEENFYIIDDPTIRMHMSGIIGKIASSHHWNLSKVAALPRSINIVSPYNIHGAFRPMFLAGLMRTADAIQIDNSRAPDFEFALANPQGASRHHWDAQNRLATGADASDATALSINSTVPFKDEDAAAWWIAYDLAKNADKELRETDALLRDFAQPKLKLRRVKDIGSPDRFSEQVQTDGWRPINAEIKMGNASKIIQMLGGKGLYGNDVIVPLREILQNAIDAVRARRIIDKNFKGKINVEIALGKNTSGKSGYWLRVIDDGLGMSLSILSGPFLTFGESGWSSSVLKSERTGFIGQQFSHIGRYGIGFFSAFMISDLIKIKSRSFDQGLSEGKILEFSSGFASRPIIRDCPGTTMSEVTTDEIFIDNEICKRILAKSTHSKVLFDKNSTKDRVDKSNEYYSLFELIGMLCPLIDVDIECFDSDSNFRGTIDGNWSSCDIGEWLCRINAISNDEIASTVRSNLNLIEVIHSKTSSIGRASLNPTSQSLGIYAVGGLGRKLRDGVEFRTGIVGCLDNDPSGPKRDIRPAYNTNAVKDWATSQVKKWAQVDVSPLERNFIAANACKYGGDSTIIANAQVDGKWLSVDEVFEILKADNIYAPIKPDFGTMKSWVISGSVNLMSGHLYHPDDVEVERKNVLVAGMTEDIPSYWNVPDDNEEKEVLSFLRILSIHCQKNGRLLKQEGAQIDFGFYKGQTIRNEMRVNGERIVLLAVELSLEPCL